MPSMKRLHPIASCSFAIWMNCGPKLEQILVSVLSPCPWAYSALRSKRSGSVSASSRYILPWDPKCVKAFPLFLCGSRKVHGCMCPLLPYNWGMSSLWSYPAPSSPWLPSPVCTPIVEKVLEGLTASLILAIDISCAYYVIIMNMLQYSIRFMGSSWHWSAYT